MNPISEILHKVLPPASLYVDCERINYKPFMGRRVVIPWTELQEVEIETTDKGPWLEDFFAVLRTAKRTVRIPQEIFGFEKLMGQFQQLPGFDNEAVIQAASSTVNAKFPCWKRGSA